MNFLDVESEVPNSQLQVVLVVMFTWEQGHGGHLDTSHQSSLLLSSAGLHQWLFPTINQTLFLTIMGNLIKPAKNNVSSNVGHSQDS